MNELKEIINRHINKGVYMERQARFVPILDELLEIHPGNIIEIGGGHGESTQIFCSVARIWCRRVLVVDPFESGWDVMPDDYRYPYDIFLEKTKKYDNLTICKKLSSDDGAYLKMREFEPIAFMFIDGSQLFADVTYDLCAAHNLHSHIICVDDIHRTNDRCKVPQAVEHFSKQFGYKIIAGDTIEGYLIKQ